MITAHFTDGIKEPAIHINGYGGETAFIAADSIEDALTFIASAKPEFSPQFASDYAAGRISEYVG